MGYCALVTVEMVHDFFLDGEKKVDDEDLDVRKRLVHVWGLQAVALVERRWKEVDEMFEWAL